MYAHSAAATTRHSKVRPKPRWWAVEHWLTIISWSELLGGAAAIPYFAIVGVRGWPLVVALAFCVSSVAAGGLLRRGSPLGRALSVVVQLAQLCRVTTGGITVRIAAGLAAIIWYRRPGGWDAILGVTAGYRFGRAPAGHVDLGVNLFAVFAVYALVRRPQARGRNAPFEHVPDAERLPS